MCLAYVSIPINFERPNSKHFAYFLKGSASSKAIMLSQVILSSGGLAAITWLFVFWYLPDLKEFSGFLALLNGLAYGSTLLMEYSVLRYRLTHGPKPELHREAGGSDP
jgi:hypothetical protein